jgi:hypothetical protein
VLNAFTSMFTKDLISLELALNVMAMKLKHTVVFVMYQHQRSCDIHVYMMSCMQILQCLDLYDVNLHNMAYRLLCVFAEYCLFVYRALMRCAHNSCALTNTTHAINHDTTLYTVHHNSNCHAVRCTCMAQCTYST